MIWHIPYIRQIVISGISRNLGSKCGRRGAWGRRAPAKPANEVTTGFGAEGSASDAENPKPVPSTSFCEPYREAIELGLSHGRNTMAIWQDLVSEHGFRGGYQTVKRFVRKLRGNQPPQPRAVIVTAPEETQVDYGKGPMTREPRAANIGAPDCLS